MVAKDKSLLEIFNGMYNSLFFKLRSFEIGVTT